MQAGGWATQDQLPSRFILTEGKNKAGKDEAGSVSLTTFPAQAGSRAEKDVSPRAWRAAARHRNQSWEREVDGKETSLTRTGLTFGTGGQWQPGQVVLLKTGFGFIFSYTHLGSNFDLLVLV